MRFAVGGVYGNALDPPVAAHDRDIVDEDLAAPAKLGRQRLSLIFGPSLPEKRNRVGQPVLRNFLARLRYRVTLCSGRFSRATADSAAERGANRQDRCSALQQHCKLLPAKPYNPPSELGMNGTGS
jgi:hypothetical protein